MHGFDSRTTQPAMNRSSILLIFLAKLCSQIAFLRKNEEVMTEKDRKDQRGQSPGDIQREVEAQEHQQARQIERVSRRGKDACLDQLAGWVARVRGLTEAGKLASRPRDQAEP